MFTYTMFIVLIFIDQLCFISNQKTDSRTSRRFKNDINDCDRCRIYSDSFSYWYDKTSRGKFEGGDALWEEKKLKSYSRSEIRLVEIQEGLCSELKKNKDECYVLNEKTEHSLEKWWFNDKIKETDLYNWLCIEEMKYCCPKSSYGVNCEPCPSDSNNEICSGKGRCDGDGLRKGSGQCVCPKGYIGNLCDDCAETYYRNNDNNCEPCHKSCSNCTGPGPGLCMECKAGWVLNEEDNCEDINECFNKNKCQKNEYCENEEGSYLCKKCDDRCGTCIGAGPTNCTSCHIDGSTLWSGICVDESLREDLIRNALFKILMYIGLICILYFVSKTSTLLGTFVAIVIGIYIYVVESKMVISSFNVLLYVANIK